MTRSKQIDRKSYDKLGYTVRKNVNKVTRKLITKAAQNSNTFAPKRPHQF